jgi:hypothetical protein
MYSIPHYDPSKFIENAKSLNDRVKEWILFFKTFYAYQQNYFQRLETALKQDGDASPFQTIPSAATITPLRGLQPVTGSITVTRIETAVPTPRITLLAVDGFSVDVGGNIATNKAIGAKMAQTFYYNPSEALWYLEN